MNDIDLLKESEQRARLYLESLSHRRVFPSAAALQGLDRFDEPLPVTSSAAIETLRLLDEAGSPATVTSNGPNYFGFVIGATMPVADAAERLALAWDQCASSFDNSPAAATLEHTAAQWLLEILDLPRHSAVAFTTSATTGSLACLAAARRQILSNLGWDFDQQGLNGSPPLRVVVSETVHITLLKALRILGFGLGCIEYAAVDEWGRVDPAQLPLLDERTILCLQAGEVNTGEFDPFNELIPLAKKLGAWVHVDGAFGLWARASKQVSALADGVDGADSWTTDGHKWLNTPYDGAIAICRSEDALYHAMQSDAVYATASKTSQKNLAMEFSRRARGIPIWAVLRSLGRVGVAEMIDRHCRQAKQLAQGLQDAGYSVLNRVVLNQVLVKLQDDHTTNRVRELANASGQIWFGPSRWQGQQVFRLSVSSWRTKDENIRNAIQLLSDIKQQLGY